MKIDSDRQSSTVQKNNFKFSSFALSSIKKGTVRLAKDRVFLDELFAS